MHDGISVSIDDDHHRRMVTAGAGRISVRVDDIAPSSTLRVNIGPVPDWAPNDAAGRLFAMLDRAQIEYES